MSLPQPLSAHDLAIVDAQVQHTFDDGHYGHFEIAKLRASPDNRKRFNEQALQELAESIKTMGVAQAILIRPVTPTADAPQEFEIVAGERRFRASKIAGKTHIPALCRQLSDLDAAKIRILENLQREDPHPMEEAEGYQLLMLQHGFTADQLVDEIKKSRAYVYARLKLCALTNEVRTQFMDEKFSAATALLIARIPSPALQSRAAKEVSALDWQGNPMSYRAQRDLLRQRFMLDLRNAVFSIKDTALLVDVGSCVECPKRSGNQPEAFEGEKHENLCTDPDCFAEKTAAHSKKAKQKAKDRGLTIISGEAAKKIMPNSYSNLKGGYADVDKDMYVAGVGMTSYRKLLGKQTPQGQVLESPFVPGKLITIAKIDELEDLVTAVAGSGKTEASVSAKQKAKEKQQEQAAAIEKRFRRDLFVAVRDAGRVENPAINEQEVAALLFRNCPGNEEPFIRKLYGWTGPEFESGTWDGKYISGTTRICDAIRQMTTDEARQLIRDMTFVRELEVNTYTSSKQDAPLLMLAAAMDLGIDVRTMRNGIEHEAKQKAAEKAAKKLKAANKAKTPAQAALPEVAPASAAIAARRRPAVEVAYRNPGDATQAWTGRGRQPKWVSEWVESGKSLDALKVPPAAAVGSQVAASAESMVIA